MYSRGQQIVASASNVCSFLFILLSESTCQTACSAAQRYRLMACHEMVEAD
jgi:hypothetical protein